MCALEVRALWDAYGRLLVLLLGCVCGRSGPWADWWSRVDSLKDPAFPGSSIQTCVTYGDHFVQLRITSASLQASIAFAGLSSKAA